MFYGCLRSLWLAIARWFSHYNRLASGGKVSLSYGSLVFCGLLPSHIGSLASTLVFTYTSARVGSWVFSTGRGSLHHHPVYTIQLARYPFLGCTVKNGSLQHIGFRFFTGSLLASGLLAKRGSLSMKVFFYSFGSLFLNGFLSPSGSLFHYGFLNFSGSLPHLGLLYSIGSLCGYGLLIHAG